MNFRAQAEMLVLFPKRILAVWKDNTMPKRDWSKYDEPAIQRKRTANSLEIRQCAPSSRTNLKSCFRKWSAT